MSNPVPVDMQVDHPNYYNQGSIECIDALEAALTPEQFLGFLRGTSLRYLWRAGRKKDATVDLQKAVWYITKEVEVITRPAK